MCREMDQPCAALIKDLKARGLLESTLVIWGGELGRSDVVQVPAKKQGGTIGRDHHIDAFTVWMAGGGVRAGQTVGATDEIGFNPIDHADPCPRPPGDDSPPAGYWTTAS